LSTRKFYPAFDWSASHSLLHRADAEGNTLIHLAVSQENDALLGVLLEADLPSFWLPANNKGEDILSLATGLKNRVCVKKILDRIVLAKQVPFSSS
jgi:ankyrin repeat protein